MTRLSDDLKKLGVRQGPETREQTLARSPLPEFYVFWHDTTEQIVIDFEDALKNANSEAPLQRFLEEYPLMLIQHLGGGQGRWVVPQKRLGAEYVIDFIIGDKDSMGYHWRAVELESPLEKMFTKKGDPTSTLTHAIRQIQDWRAWLRKNQNYASHPRDASGLGLTDIECDLPGLILIGRKDQLDSSTTQRRRQMKSDLNIEIHTYDWLIDRAR